MKITSGHMIWNWIFAIASLTGTAWLLWRWLRASDEPVILIIRWLISAVVLGYVFRAAARAKDEFSMIAAVLLGAVGGLIMTFVWRQKFLDFVGEQIASIYTGGSREVDPAPFYSIAEAKRKRGQYLEAIAEIRAQLERFPTDFTGRMLVAEIQAEDLKDVASGQETVDEILAQEGHAPKNIAFALSRVADWHLKLTQDREAARAALERIVELLPETEQAQLARQRIAHLTPAEMLAERQEPHRMAVEQRNEYIGLRDEPLNITAPTEDPNMTAANYVRHLDQFPYDSDAREKLALLYARHYQRLDMATDQLEQLATLPNQQPKQVVHWLNLLADLQIELTGDVALPRQTLQRIVDLFPKSAAAANALNRIARLQLELRPKQESQVVKLGSYAQNIGLTSERPRDKSSD